MHLFFHREYDIIFRVSVPPWHISFCFQKLLICVRLARFWIERCTFSFLTRVHGTKERHLWGEIICIVPRVCLIDHYNCKEIFVSFKALKLQISSQSTFSETSIYSTRPNRKIILLHIQSVFKNLVLYTKIKSYLQYTLTFCIQNYAVLSFSSSCYFSILLLIEFFTQRRKNKCIIFDIILLEFITSKS